MIPDRKIAERFSLGPTKASYAICYGLAPFYKDKIMKQLTPKDTEPPYFVWCFDEAFNVVSNRKQFYVHRIYFDEHLQRTQRRCFNSQFMGHARASDLMQSLIEVLKDLDKLIKWFKSPWMGPM